MRKINILNKNFEKAALYQVAYKNKTNDEIVYKDTNGKEYTYNDIFVGMNLISNSFFDTSISGWGGDNSNGGQQRGRAEVQWDGGGVYFSLQQQNVDLEAENHFVYAEVKSPQDLTEVSVQLRFSSLTDAVVIKNLTPNQKYKVSNKITGGANASGYFRIICDDVTDTENTMYLDNLIVLNLKHFETEPTTKQLHEWFQTFLKRRKIPKAEFTYKDLFENYNLMQNGEMEKDSDNNGLADDWSLVMTVEQQYIKKQIQYVKGDANFTGFMYQNYDYEHDHNYYLNFDLDIIEESDIDYFVVYYRTQYPAASSDSQYLLTSSNGKLTKGFYNYSFLTRVDEEISDKGSMLFGAFAFTDAEYGYGNIFQFDMEIFDEDMTQAKMDEIVKQYKNIKYENQAVGYKYFAACKTIFDVAYINKTIDEVAYIDSDGTKYSYRDIFEKNSLVGRIELYDNDQNGYADGWGNSGVVSSKRVEDEIQYLTAASQYAGVRYNLWGDNTIGDQLFFSAELKADDALCLLLINDGANQEAVAHSGSDRWERLSSIYALQAVGAEFIKTQDNRSSAWTEQDFREPVVVNITKLFITPPTQQQMEDMLEIYLKRKDIVKTKLTYDDIFAGKERENFEDAPIENFTGNINPGGSISLEASKNYYHSARFELYSGTYNSHGLFYVSSPTLGNVEQFKVEPGERKSIITNSLDYPSYNFYFSGTVNLSARLIKVYEIIVDGLFDENITAEKLDNLLETYLKMIKVVETSESHLITDPSGLGSDFKMESVNEVIYNAEQEYNDVELKFNFGINNNAYQTYNDLIKFLKENECIIQYDWGDGYRYIDARLRRAPKREKDTFNTIREKFGFARLGPYYEYIKETTSTTIQNDHPKKLQLKIEMQVNSAAVQVEFENQETSNIDAEIAFDFTGESFPFTLIIDAENRTIKKDDGTNMYSFLDFSKQSFFDIPEGPEYLLYFNGATNAKITYKQWVVD